MQPPDLVLRAPDGSEAVVAPGRGMNCYRWRVPSQGEVVDVLWAQEGFAQGEGRASASGVPVLFPFPGRMQGNRLHYQGRQFCFPYEDGQGNAIHGLVLEQPWQVEEQGEDFVQGRFRASEHLDRWEQHWPVDFELRLRVELEPKRLRFLCTVTNPDTRALPWGLGLHPYFCVPLGRSGQGEECWVQVPCSAQVELQAMIPTGRLLPPEHSLAPILKQGMPLQGRQLDCVLTGLEPSQHWQARVRDPHNQRQMVLVARGMPHAVVYTPPHRQAVCIEPYTCTPGAFNTVLEGRWQGEYEVGIRWLPPGEQAQVEMILEVQEEN